MDHRHRAQGIPVIWPLEVARHYAMLSLIVIYRNDVMTVVRPNDGFNPKLETRLRAREEPSERVEMTAKRSCPEA